MNPMSFMSSGREFLARTLCAGAALALQKSHLFAQGSLEADAHIVILPNEPIATIAPETYGQFIEELVASMTGYG